MKRINIFIVILLSLSFRVYSQVKSEIPQRKATLSFKENKGQIGDQFSKPRPDILFTGNSGNLVFHLRNTGISYQMYRVDEWKQSPSLPDSYRDLPKGERTEQAQRIKSPSPLERDGRERPQTTIYRLDINWLNANSTAGVSKENVLEGHDNYYSEVCPNGVTGVKSYKNITYQNLYKGIDLKWYEKNGNLKYDYIVAPGIDHRQIQLEIKGAENISVNKNGELIIKTPLGILTEKAPYVTQNGKVLKAKWIINKSTVSFDIANVDATKQLVIDPLVRLWGTYYGGTGDDRFNNSVIDATGNIYATGYSDSQFNIATVGAHQTIYGGGPSGPGPGFYDDAILVKFNSAGVRLWGTYYGGSGGEYGQNCDIDPTGNYVVMVGCTSTTLSSVIATPGTHQSNYGGNTSGAPGDAFLVVFNSAGVRQWGTYYGGASYESGWGCDFDINGDIYITGETTSTTSIASSGAHQTIYGGGQTDGYIAKFNNSGTRLWATYYGGDKMDRILSSSSDPSGNVFIIGHSRSPTNISTAGAYQVLYSGPDGWGEGVIAKFNSSGVRQWGTYYGGQGDDQAYNCVFDASGNIYVSGITTVASQTVICTVGAHQTTFGGNSYDAYLLKLSPAGTRLWCTLYGGLGNEIFNWCSVDPLGNIYLSGCTTSTNNISTPCAFQTDYSGNIDCYLVKFNSDGTRLWGTYYGGSRYDDYCASSTDLSGNVYLVGWTDTDTILATQGSHQPVYGGGVHGVDGDGFIAKFDGCIPNPVNTTSPSSLTICLGKSTVLTTSPSCDITWFDVSVDGTAIGNGSVFTTPTLSTTTTFYVNEASCGSNTIRTAITVSVNALPVVSIDLSPTVLCYKTSLDAKATGAVSYTWYPDKWISCTNCFDPVLAPLETMEYCVEGMDNNSCVSRTCVNVEVNFSRDHNFSLPNAFTPNGDGNNDSFCLQGWSVCNDNFLIKIFDRWGEKVFESNDPDFCWDGFYKGQLLNADVFVYSVTANYKDDTKVNKKGNITLIR